jgi:hypothetical protein
LKDYPIVNPLSFFPLPSCCSVFELT